MNYKYDPILCMNVPVRKANDEDIKLVKTVASKNGYSVHIVEGAHGQRVVLTFKGESYKNPHMWLGSATQSNINSAIKVMEEFAKTKDDAVCVKGAEDKEVQFPSEKEAIEYCKENGINPHKIKLIGDKYVVNDALNRAIKMLG